MGKSDLQPASLDDFAYWVNERHRIYLKRAAGEDKPWTDDKIFREWKFTNVYRQLDKGTQALTEMLKGHEDPELLIFNIMWYRFFNRWEHAEQLGFIEHYDYLEGYIKESFRQGKKIFTGAYMTTGVSFEDKHISYLRACKEAWDQRGFIANICKYNSMEALFHKLKQIYMIGKFVAYEMVCDFRFHVIEPDDNMTWANVGPGANRGLRRLGKKPGLLPMVDLLLISEQLFEPHVFDCEWPFELREIEHSLCEFDKYQRIKTGVGRPRSRYDGCGS